MGQADEVVVTIQGSKTDIYNRGETRNHFRASNPDGTADKLCVVRAVELLYFHFPDRAPGQPNEDQPLLNETNGTLITREAVQVLLKLSAKALGLDATRLGSHSLRFGGASALWAAYQDSALVRRWGRWATDTFQTYVWEGRSNSKNVASAMSQADLTPA